MPSVLNSLDQDQARQMSGLIWIKIVCKDNQQMTLGGKGVNMLSGTMHVDLCTLCKTIMPSQHSI